MVKNWQEIGDVGGINEPLLMILFNDLSPNSMRCPHMIRSDGILMILLHLRISLDKKRNRVHTTIRRLVSCLENTINPTRWGRIK